MANLWETSTIPIPVPTPWYSTPNKSMPVVIQNPGTPQLPVKTLGETVDRYGVQWAPKQGASGIGRSLGQNAADLAGDIQGSYNYRPWDGGGAVGGGSYGGGGGGGGAAAAQKLVDDMRAKQQEYGDREKGLITGRRDAFIGDTEKGFQDQLTWLQSQTDSAKAGAEAGIRNVNTQRDQSIASTERTAEGEARDTRDVYQDLILENRRRTRATGAGSSSAFLELSNRLDTQLQKGLTQIGDTKVEKVGVANTIAQQAVGELERTLQNVLAQIEQNKSTSMREKDKLISDARLNADEAILAVDRWLTETFSSLDQAKLSLRTGGGGGGGGASYNKTDYAQSVNDIQASLLANIGENLMGMENAGMTSQAQKQAFLQSQLPNMRSAGINPLDMGRYFGIYMPEDDQPTSAIGLWQQQNPGASVEDWLRLNQQYSGLNFGNNTQQSGKANIWGN